MTAPSPSAIRVVNVGGAPSAFGARFSGPSPCLQWPSKHPLDNDWWWVDATAWCSDIGDVLGTLNMSNVAFSGGDSAMSILAVANSADNLQVGIRFSAGTSGVFYSVTVTLAGLLGLDTKAVDIAFPCFGL
jgi:hypothetical protein